MTFKEYLSFQVATYFSAALPPGPTGRYVCHLLKLGGLHPLNVGVAYWLEGLSPNTDVLSCRGSDLQEETQQDTSDNEYTADSPAGRFEEGSFVLPRELASLSESRNPGQALRRC